MACRQPRISIEAVATARSYNANPRRREVLATERAAEAPRRNTQLRTLPTSIDVPRFIPVVVEKPAYANPRVRVEVRQRA
jgi:hypothetical protein